MKTITIANTKGGVGKTTTAVYLAYAAQVADRRARVLLLDLDPQQSAASWASIARDADDPLPYAVREGTLRDLQELQALQAYDVVVVDTPTGDGRLLSRLAGLSDLVVVPTQAEGLGLARTYATLDAAGERCAVLLTQIRPRTRLYTEAKDALEQADAAVFDAEIPDRIHFKTYGTCPDKAYEYAAAWREIKEATDD